MPDRDRGFVQKGRGIQATNKTLAKAYADASKHPPYPFDENTQRLLIETAIDVCIRREWRLHATAAEPTHLHVLVSWSEENRWQDVRGKIKNLMSLEISRRNEKTDRPWFSRHASRKRVRDRQHFEHLLDAYLPRHHGLKWFERHGWVT